MSKISISIDTSTKTASVMLDGKEVQNICGATFQSYEYKDCEGEEHKRSHIFLTVLKEDEETDVCFYNSMSWSWEDEMEAEYAESSQTAASAIMAGTLSKLLNNK